MRFGASDQADTSQIEDRRGRGFGFPGGGWGAGGGVGIVGLLLYVIVRALGGGLGGGNDATDTTEDPRAGRTNVQPGSGGSGGGTTPILGGSCAGVTSGTDQAKFIACVETNVQSFWAHELPNDGVTYAPSKLVLFTDETPSGCGDASAATGPFYCPRDAKVYLDLGFFDELHGRLGARGGDFAEAYVVAHEYGHHVQDLLGIEQKVRAAMRARPRDENALSVKLELQADCFAGVWGHAAYAQGKVEKQEIADALDAAAAVGDDRIQKEVQGRVRPETFTHGTSAERQAWFERGMQSGSEKDCETFSQSP